MRRSRRFSVPATFVWLTLVFSVLAGPVSAQNPPHTPADLQRQIQGNGNTEATMLPLEEIQIALVRLPLAAALGATLALRPRRRGTPPRTPAVVQTQIMLSVVGAVIMLVVGASLARAFGIVGAANLIRYRSKIDDPKDAVVMLCALAVGLAAGVGLYALTVFSTAFMGAALWVIESFEPSSRDHFIVKVKAGDDTDSLRPRIEGILRSFNLEFSLRSSSDEEVCYDVQVPMEIQTDDVSDAILKLDPKGHAAVEWEEKKVKK